MVVDVVVSGLLLSIFAVVKNLCIPVFSGDVVAVVLLTSFFLSRSLFGGLCLIGEIAGVVLG